MNNMKNLMFVLLLVSLVFVCGCYSTPNNVSDVVTQSNPGKVDESVTTELHPEERKDDYESKIDCSWVDVYIEALRRFDYFNYPNVALIYINDDEIPEIIFEGNCNADGTMLLTIGKDNSVKSYKSGFAVSYIPEKNIVFSFYAGGGGIDEEILCIDDGDWRTLFYGTSAFVPDTDTGDYKKYDYKPALP